MTLAPLSPLKTPPTIIAKPIDKIPTLRSSLTQEIPTTITRAIIDAQAAAEISILLFLLLLSKKEALSILAV